MDELGIIEFRLLSLSGEGSMNISNEILEKYIKDAMEKMDDDHRSLIKDKADKHTLEVLENPQFKRIIKYTENIRNDFINTLRIISVYSTRTPYYEDSLTIFMIDELIESMVGISVLIREGMHNICRRELRYLLELAVKLTIVDMKKKELSLNDKVLYLKSDVPNSSIDYIDEICLPFKTDENKQFTDEVKDIYKKLCAYVHPSKKQIHERLNNYKKGVTIGFESFDMLEKLSRELFRIYDIILVLMLNGFGKDMSGDLFVNAFEPYNKWKFHKGKYTKMYSKLFNYKYECQ